MTGASRHQRNRAQGIAFIYVVKCGWDVKVGFTFDVKARISQIQNANSRRVRIIREYELPADVARTAERGAHELRSSYRIRGEWFRAPPDVIERAIDLAILRARGEPWPERKLITV